MAPEHRQVLLRTIGFQDLHRRRGSTDMSTRVLSADTHCPVAYIAPRCDIALGFCRPAACSRRLRAAVQLRDGPYRYSFGGHNARILCGIQFLFGRLLNLLGGEAGGQGFAWRFGGSLDPCSIVRFHACGGTLRRSLRPRGGTQRLGGGFVGAEG